MVRDLKPSADPFAARFELPVTGDQIYLNRAHPAVEGLASFVLESALDEAANARAEALLESHLRVREASRAGGRNPVVEPFLPVDVLGIYVFLPV